MHEIPRRRPRRLEPAAQVEYRFVLDLAPEMAREDGHWRRLLAAGNAETEQAGDTGGAGGLEAWKAV